MRHGATLAFDSDVRIGQSRASDDIACACSSQKDIVIITWSRFVTYQSGVMMSEGHADAIFVDLVSLQYSADAVLKVVTEFQNKKMEWSNSHGPFSSTAPARNQDNR